MLKANESQKLYINKYYIISKNDLNNISFKKASEMIKHYSSLKREKINVSDLKKYKLK